MLTQPLLDKLAQLRLPAFCAALQEQLHNPQYADLPFEDRLALLVDRECTHRDNNRLKRRLKASRLPLQATIEALDLSPVSRTGSPSCSPIGPGRMDPPTSQRPHPRPNRRGKDLPGIRTRPRMLPPQLRRTLRAHLPTPASHHPGTRRRILPSTPRLLRPCPAPGAR